MNRYTYMRFKKRNTVMLFVNFPCIFVLIVFMTFIGIFISKIVYIHLELKNINAVLDSFNKNDLFYRFQELNEVMDSKPFIRDFWNEFKSTLMFQDKEVCKNNSDKLYFDSVSSNECFVYCTVDSNYFFNEETLINQKINHRLFSSMPALLTGLGPLGTFLFIAIGFSKVNFASENSTVSSISNLMVTMKTAAMISILAIGSALAFIVIEKILYYFFCKKPLNLLQLKVNRLFEKITPEKFLIELLKETQKQNTLSENLLTNLPQNIKQSMEQSIKSSVVPYLENIISILNENQENSPLNAINNILGNQNK